MTCTIPPFGWVCSREEGHDGPCAASFDTRRITELVAKAMDIPGEWDDAAQCFDPHKLPIFWNPLENSKDAFVVQTTCRIDVTYGGVDATPHATEATWVPSVFASYVWSDGINAKTFEYTEPINDNVKKATRMAIAMVAAQIGLHGKSKYML